MRHGCKPYFVVSCSDVGDISWWEWNVSLRSRAVEFVPEDWGEILRTIDDADEIVLQNAKFDVTAVESVVPDYRWPWEKTHDLLLAAHLLRSDRLKSLDALALQYLRVDIRPYEERLKKACDEARRWCRTNWPLAAITREGMRGMPSAKGTLWKNDTWLPRRIAEFREGLGHVDFDRDTPHVPDEKTGECPPLHHWWTALSEYATKDAEVTVALWPVMRNILARRNLLRIYEERRKLLRVNYEMERNGVTLSRKRQEEQEAQLRRKSIEAGEECVQIAADRGHVLDLPKTGNNGSLLDFAESPTGLNLIPFINPDASYIFGSGGSDAVAGTNDDDDLVASARAALFAKRANKPGFGKNGRLTMNKAMVEWFALAVDADEPNGPRTRFLKALKDKRKRDTALMYMAAYERFGRPAFGQHFLDALPEYGDFLRLHPSLNPVGTHTLRWSCSNPNEQNISKQEGFNLRYAFGPAPGREWWSLDAKNIELRIPAYEAGEMEMIALFERPNDPPYYGSNHMLVFHLLWPDLWDEAVKEVGIEKAGSFCKKKYASTYYQWVKNGNFAVQYGAIERDDGTGTADRAYHQKGGHRKVKAKFSRMDALNRKCIEQAQRLGYVETMPDRTVDPERGYPLWCTRTDNGKILPTVPLNYHVQGTAMQWMCKAMVRVQEYFDTINRNIRRFVAAPAFMTMQVHDELVLDLPAYGDPRVDSKRSNLPIAREVSRLMELGGDDIGIPTPTSIEYHPVSWSEGVGF